MKIRNGFVSNSSSASFVVLGVPVSRPDTDSDEEMDAFYDKSIMLDDGGLYVVGEYLAKEQDYYLGNAEYSLDELQAKAKVIAEKHNVDVSQVKLYMGTRPC